MKKIIGFAFIFMLMLLSLCRAAPIHDAVIASDQDLAKKILEKDPSQANALDKEGCTPLHYTAAMGNYSFSLLLVSNSGDVAIKDKRGKTALHEAAAIGSTPVMNLLMEKASPVNAKDGLGRTPLHYAAEFSSIEAVELLVSRGAEINEPDNWGDKPLKFAEKGSQTYEYLKSLGATE